MTPRNYSSLNPENFTGSAKQLTGPNSKKSYAQVASSVASHDSHDVALRSAELRPIPRKSKSAGTHGLRLRPGELDLIRAKAAELKMSVNAYVRAKALGEDYIERPPVWLRDVLLQLYVELAGQGNNLNQLTRKANAGFAKADEIIDLVDRQRLPIFRVIERLELALAGRRPPDDY